MVVTSYLNLTVMSSSARPVDRASARSIRANSSHRTEISDERLLPLPQGLGRIPHAIRAWLLNEDSLHRSRRKAGGGVVDRRMDYQKEETSQYQLFTLSKTTITYVEAAK